MIHAADIERAKLGRNPFQGGMGFFTGSAEPGEEGSTKSRNPFQGGMGFFTPRSGAGAVCLLRGRNPFQGGMGFFTISVHARIVSPS